MLHTQTIQTQPTAKTPFIQTVGGKPNQSHTPPASHRPPPTYPHRIPIPNLTSPHLYKTHSTSASRKLSRPHRLPIQNPIPRKNTIKGGVALQRRGEPMDPIFQPKAHRNHITYPDKTLVPAVSTNIQPETSCQNCQTMGMLILDVCMYVSR